jgi:hypothetical protein
VPYALPAHTFRDTLGHANVARLLAYFMPVHSHYEALCPFRYL